MKSKILITILVVLSILFLGYAFNFKSSQAETQTAVSNDCDKKTMEKLDKILANQADILGRLDSLGKLIKTRKGD